MKIVSFSLEAGNQYHARVDGTKFFVGQRVSYDGRKGLSNLRGGASQRYSPDPFRPAHGFWADFIHPTSVCEGGLFHTLNTYDRARFTFTAFQFAAHVPDGDFVVYFRRLLSLPPAAEYFPDLRVADGRICRVDGDATQPLESAASTQGLMDYLNPSDLQVEDTEVIQAARFIHWVQNDPTHRELQVQVAVEHFRTRLAGYAQLYGLDGQSDVVCLVVADIRHQGRANSSDIRLALATPDALGSLLKLGAATYPERVATLRREIRRLTDAGVLGQRRYRLDRQEFVA